MNKAFLGVLFFGFMAAQGASAACFTFDKDRPTQIGPVKLAAEPTQVCVNSVKKIGGRVYYSVRFADAKGDLAQLASQTEVKARCPGFCRTYTLTSGNSNGKNVDPDNTVVQFQVETESGTVSISHKPTKQDDKFDVTKK